MGFVGKKIVLLKYSYKRCSLFREDRYKEDLWWDIYRRSVLFCDLQHTAERDLLRVSGQWQNGTWKHPVGTLMDDWVLKLYLLAQKTFQKGIQEGTEYFTFWAGNIRIYNLSSLLVIGWENRHLFPIKDVDLWAGLLLFHIKSIPAVANREDPSLCKSSNMVYITELNLLMSCNHYMAADITRN